MDGRGQGQGQGQRPEMKRSEQKQGQGNRDDARHSRNTGTGLRRLLWWGTGVLAVGLLVAVVWWKPWEPGREQLSADAAAQAVLAQYPGEILHSTLQDGAYMIQLRSETGLYDVQVNATTAAVQSIQRLETSPQVEEKTLLSREQMKSELLKQRAGEQLVSLELVEQQGSPVYSAVVKAKDNSRQELTMDPYTGEVLSSKAIKADPSSEAGGTTSEPKFLSEKQAKQKALSRVPGEVDDVELRGTNSGNPYYLVEIDLEDGREATVQVNAISGAIRSVTWDKDDD
ncbi:PepSY domain-containing protein [Paenibacillus silvae]|uniref:PepSY domain-containing protein n=1 Tax=Paenibacillus silvae TaxID=1325358 RepID=UPI0020053F1F|nr:PepSY domain-containing protein [Paenibacillus silvae]MCK6076007.1 PepSY domain-containing protein [Paenibacillus silvae]MCK6150396.1 PepSY domain-containing protein [Paenibacillus silvae]MCK6268694.1 PepSY domain-containing protein [Paenibacillus silvae]